MSTLCDHIRRDGYECMQQASWVISPDNDPHSYTRSCNNHLWQFMDKDGITYVAGVKRG